MNEYHPEDTGAETPQEGTGPESGAEPRPARNEGFTDASYIPRDRMPKTPRVYTYGEGEEKKTRPEREKKSHRRMRGGTIVALCVVCILLGAVLGILAMDRLTGPAQPAETPVRSSDTTPQPTEVPETSTAAPETEIQEEPAGTLPLTSQEGGEVMSAQAIYEMACTQVVGITTEVTYYSNFGVSTIPVSGTGLILSEDGYILTNHHVIEDAVEGGYEVTVVFYNGDTYTAEIVGYEGEENDIAVLKIDAEGLNPVTLGDSNEMQVGETVYAVGNPLGELTYTMTQGMISALDREITTESEVTGEKTTVNMFQVDAAINSGNSGGPIYNTRGQVIGVVTAKYSASGVEGLGFAIPINDAIDIANDLIENGYVRGKPYMGVTVLTVSRAVAQYYNMVEGACVYSIDDGSAAAKAGLELGDIITKVGDVEITSSSDLTSANKAYRAGDTAVLTVYRNGEYLELEIVFDEKVPQTSVVSSADRGYTGNASALPGFSAGTGWY